MASARCIGSESLQITSVACSISAENSANVVPIILWDCGACSSISSINAVSRSTPVMSTGQPLMVNNRAIVPYRSTG